MTEKKKNPGGRPQKYTPKSLMQKAVKYFTECDETVLSISDKTGLKIFKPKTLTGLCLYLGVSKDYISEKAKDEMFSETIKKIRTNVENSIEEGILSGAYNPTAGIFNLKNNFGWQDKNETEFSGGFTLTSALTNKKIEQRKEFPE